MPGKKLYSLSVVFFFRRRGSASGDDLGWSKPEAAVGAITGLLVGRYFDWPLTRWTWIVPLVILLASMIFIPPPRGASLFGYWFGWSGASGRVFPPLQSGITMPFYLSATYSLFSILGQLWRRQRRSSWPVPSKS